MTMFIVEQAPFGGWRHHLARWEACHWILSRLTAPYSTAITDSLDSQVASASLRIQFAGVTPVPLLPPAKPGHYGYWAAAAMEIMTVTVITVCAADRRHIYSSPKAIPPPFESACQGQAEPSEPFEPGSPRGLYHSSSPQGSSEILSRRMYTFSVSYSICSDQRVTARMRSWVRAHSRRMKVTLSRL